MNGVAGARGETAAPPRRTRRAGLAGIATSMVASTIVIVAVAPQIAHAAAISVTTAADEQSANGQCSLREALSNAEGTGTNVDCAAGTVGADVITFAIPGNGLHTITIVNQPLQAITDQVNIDGLTQSGSAAGAPTIEIIGRAGERLLDLSATDNSVVNGLILSGASGRAAIVAGQGTIVTANFIGTDSSGAAVAALTNGTGVLVDGVGNVRIGGTTPTERNIISGNGVGVVLSGSSGNGTFNTTIAGNYIGIDTTGTSAVPNSSGVQVNHDVSSTSIRFNVISGNSLEAIGVTGPNVAGTSVHSNVIGLGATQVAAVPNGNGVSVVGPGVDGTRIGIGVVGAENVIAGNSNAGVVVSGDTTSTFIEGNLIGVDSAGNDRGNSVGVELAGASDVTVGGNLGAGYRNVISGNSLAIYVHQPDPGLTPTLTLTGTQILGNYIGTDLTGTVAVPNDGGIYLGGTGAPNSDGFVLGTAIGDGTAGGRNVISGNTAEAISLWDRANDTSIRGNNIGVAVDGASPLGNNLAAGGYGGVVIRNFVTGTTIGGISGFDGNIIANNGVAGVTIFSGINNRVTHNSMFDNLGPGISIGAAVNDFGDPDGGANNLQNFPTISASIQGGQLLIDWDIDSLPANTAYPVTIDFYEADDGVSGEGRSSIGSSGISNTGGAIGDDIGVAAGLNVSVGDYVVATVTDDNGNTSQFSTPAVVATSLGTVTVNSVADGADATAGDGTCETVTGNGVCTLRAAIEEANAVAGDDVVHFAIAGAGVHTIMLGTNLPNITDPLTIDGLSQPGASCATWPPQLMIELDSSLVAGNSWGITVANTSATLRGLVVNHFTIDGVAAYNTTGGRLECNIIGAEPNGSPGSGFTQSGVFISGGTNWVIGGPSVHQRNLITGPNIAYQLGLTGSNSTVQNNYIGTDINGVAFASPFQTNRAIMVTGGGNLVGGTGVGEGNVIAGSAGPGIWQAFDTGNSFRGNSIRGNLGLGIDIGPGFGVTFNHVGFVSGPNDFQNYPVLTAATSTPTQTRVVGTLDGVNGTTYAIDVYSTDVCDDSGFGSGEVYLGTFNATVVTGGVVAFNNTVPLGTSEPKGITTTATDLTTGSTSEFSYCRAASTPNLTWATAQDVTSGANVQQYITDRQQEKWFKIAVQPGDEVKVQLTGLPGSAVSLHRDPNPIYNGLTNPSSAAALSAEAADFAFLPSGSLPSGSLPSGSLPSGSLPSGSLPSGSLPTGFLPSGSLPSGSLPSGSLPSGSLPSGSLPSGSLPSGSLPSGSLPSGSLPSGSLPSGSLPSGSLPSGSLPSGSLPSGSLPSGSLDAYSSAARRSLLGLSADPYAAIQTIERSTFDLQEDVYVRVVGPYDLANPFSLTVTISGGVCSVITSPPSGLAVINGSQPNNTSRATIILTDSARLPGTAGDVATALNDLQTLSNRSDVAGVVVDLNDPKYQRVAFANAQADQYESCPGAKNIVADEIKAVIDAYKNANTTGDATTLQYVVLAGGADVIPFHQVQDIAGLANEKEYVPPVQPNSPSEAGLRSGLVKGQDFYGSSLDLTIGGNTVAVPDLAVGRLVDTAGDISTTVAAYIATDGVVQPGSSLITGYDFVGDAATAVQTEIEAGTGTAADTLIQPPGHAPNAADAWSADQLRSKLLAGSHDVIMMSGHFSSGNLLAADYRTNMSAGEVQSSATDLTDSVVLALGCHSGFSLPTNDLLSGASPDPDWAKAFLRKGAAGFVAATGYAYGDTELTEYGERLFVGLSQQLRYGSGPIPLGQALVDAKRAYLANTAQMTGIDQKTIVEMTLYGLPMMKVDMPTGRTPAPTAAPIVGTPGAVPGSTTGLTSTAVLLSPITDAVDVPLTNLQTNSSVTTTYYTGRDGVVANPFEPILPKQIDNVTATGKVLRGVAFRGGTYTDVAGITPLTTAPTTETSTVHQSFNSDVFYPNQVWMPNFYDAVDGGPTRLVTVPAQFRSSSPGSTTGTVRKFSTVDLALYYLPSNWTAPDSPAAVKGAAVSPSPTITGASASVSGQIVTFSVNAQADGSAGVKQVWILYTGEPGSSYHGTWAPLDLVQDTADPTLWTGNLNVGANDPSAIRFMVQAVGGAGLATLSTGLGAYYSTPGADTPATPAVTSLTIVQAPGSGAFQAPQTFSARLTSGGGGPVAGQTLVFDIGGQQAQAVTDATGLASVEITPRLSPSSYTMQVSSKGTAYFATATLARTFTVTRASTSLNITPASTTVAGGTPTGITAELHDSADNQLGGKSIVFVVTGNSQTVARSVSADTSGVATLPALDLPPGTYSVRAYFSGIIPVVSPAVALIDDVYDASQSSSVSLTLTAASTLGITVATRNADGTPYVPGTWTKQSVVVDFACTPGAWSIVSCEPDRTVTAEGVEPASVGTVRDAANNSATVAVGPIQIDRTGPVISLTSPADGASYTVGAVVNAGFSCTETLSGVASCVGTVDTGQIDTATAGPKTFTVTATDMVGNVSTKTVSYTVTHDPSAPSITVALTNADGTPYVPGTWTKQNVNVTFTCAALSGVTSCQANRLITAAGVTAASTGSVTAANGQTATVAVPAIWIDRTAPVITITAPTNGSYALGAVVAAAFTCTDSPAGVSTCAGTVASGTAIDTTAGTKSFVVNATDNAGNTSTKSVTYTMTAANAAPVVRADMGIAGLQEIGYKSRVVVLTGSFTDADSVGRFKASVRWTPTGAFTPFVLNNNSNFVASFIYPNAGARVVTVRVCDKAGACGFDDVTVRVSVAQNVVPLRECVVDRGSRTNPRYQARFGYTNPAPFAIYVPAGGGDNVFSPSPAFRGQPVIFQPGTAHNLFTATFNSGTLSWKLNGTTVQAKSTSPRC